MENFETEKLSGWRIVELLWPFNEMFRARLHEFRHLRYDAEFEAEADGAIDGYANAPNSDSWSKLSLGAWRVLLERHQQALTAAAMMEATGQGMIEIPAGLPEDQKRAALMLIWLHRMKLPFPIEDRARLEIVVSRPPPKDRPH
jgi:hypothetical protein